jgi:hypothetical protein
MANRPGLDEHSMANAQRGRNPAHAERRVELTFQACAAFMLKRTPNAP